MGVRQPSTATTSLRRLSWLLTLIAAAGCSPSGQGLEQVKARGELVVLTRNAPTTYYEDRDGRLAGLEYEMASAFAEHLGVKARVRVLDTVEEILTELAAGGGDLAAAGLTRTAGRTEAYRFGPSYQRVQQQVVCRRGGPRPDSVEELTEVTLTVVASSSYVERLTRLKQEHPALTWRTTDDLGTEQLLEHVWERELDCTVADSNIVAINRRYFPELVVAFDLTEPQPLAWVFPAESAGLQGAVEEWFGGFAERDRLAALIEKYYGFVRVFDYVDVARFRRRIEGRLPEYAALFKRAAQHHEIDWALLAAQAYQESHWNPRAKSPTGVRGIMMLTQPTARAMGVDSRLDPKASIFAGAKYLARMRGRLPDTVAEPDRTWMALAAYNVGMAHLQDARTLARRLGKNPDVWRELKTILPLLTQKRYYSTLKHGYARGHEPVRYVQRIRNYRDMLERQLAASAALPGLARAR
ncbi:MAG: membrane-bound lytic murein transglycosylase MltF [Gammaproteobacteria bacterium]|nr:membrane-bound lytic murein transglycosylase MltF [Gammaproteobacteria bacterium]